MAGGPSPVHVCLHSHVSSVFGDALQGPLQQQRRPHLCGDIGGGGGGGVAKAPLLVAAGMLAAIETQQSFGLV